MSEEKLNDPKSETKGLLEPVAQPQDSESVEGLVSKNKELLDELKQERGKGRKTQDRLDEIETEIDKQKKAGMLEKEQYKELSEKLDKEKTDLKKELGESYTRVQETNLKLVAKDLVDPEDIQAYKHLFEFDEDHKVINAEKGMEELKKLKPHFFKSEQPQAVGVQHGVPVVNIGTGGKLDLQNLDVETYRKNKAAYDAEFDKTLKQGG